MTASSSREIMSFVAMGDTQRTMLYQILIGKEANNLAETTLLLKDIQERSPDLLVLLGDLVAWGQSEADWRYFDSLIAPLYGVPLAPVVGNHDLFILKQRSLKHLRDRFPDLAQSSYYQKRLGPLALMMLDSNDLSSGQLDWISSTLQALDADPSVKGIVCCGHHPPFTNSREIGPHLPTRKKVLPHFFQSKKSLLYLSGHAHAYERFEAQGKCLIVSGGGGGPRQRLYQGKKVRSPDLFSGKEIRPFHYLRVSLLPSGLWISVHGLEKGQTEIFLMEEFGLEWRT